MSEGRRVISREDYEGGRGEHVTLDVLPDIGRCAVRRLTGATQAGMAAIEREVVIMRVSPDPLDDGRRMVDYLVEGEDGDGGFDMEMATAVVDESGYVIDQHESEPGTVTAIERGYFIDLGRPLVEQTMHGAAAATAELDDRLVAA